jgi:hypothetical protein
MTMAKKILKALVDDLGRYVGLAEVERGRRGHVEYGYHDRDGNFQIRGIARLMNISDLSADLRYLAEEAKRNVIAVWEV